MERVINGKWEREIERGERKKEIENRERETWIKSKIYRRRGNEKKLEGERESKIYIERLKIE